MLILMMLIGMTMQATDNLVPYGDYYQSNTKDGRWNNGTYVILVAAEWCSPCKMLKDKLRADFKDIQVGLVDLDKDEVTKSLMQYGDGKVPLLLRYDIVEGKVNLRKWDRKEDLKIFLANPIK